MRFDSILFDVSWDFHCWHGLLTARIHVLGSRYLETVKPLASPQSFAKTEGFVRDFLRPDGMGPVLQKRLQERAALMEADPERKSWLIDWWNDCTSAFLDSSTYYDELRCRSERSAKLTFSKSATSHLYTKESKSKD